MENYDNIERIASKIDAADLTIEECCEGIGGMEINEPCDPEEAFIIY